ncbi:hypothetical protein V5N11_007666 [Cardamine amara subsp. amara]|uniref:Uncharacterized protein n=1 Tax=Cardamine amara subsp. amara TaxID=228776 RepID=A0ABD1B816_CARAN
MNSTAAEETHEFTRAKTSVWWDIENCPVPKGSDAHGITQTLSLALMKMNYNGPLSISSYGNTNLIPNSVQQALSSTGVSLNHVPSGRKDASDKKILVDMFLWVMDNPAPANLMLITGDGDFSDALHRLRMRRYNILLAHPQQVSAALVASANTTWLWSDFFAGAFPRLLDNAHMPSDCEVVSEQVLPRKPMDSGSGSSRAEGNKLKGIYVPKVSNQLMQQETRGKKLQKNCTKTGESVWFCKVCNVACKSFEIFTAHLSGKEHAAQLNQNLEVLGEPENIAAAPSECHDKDVEMTNKVIEYGVEASAHCDSHAAMVKKQAEAILEAKNIEESVQDNDLRLQCLDAKESIKCLEKQNKEHAEICIPSEKSGGEFWQDFIERLKCEDGAPLNVDCVFSELSRDFRVPKEVRECFDAILKKLEPSQNENVIEKLECLPKQELEMKSSEPEDTPGGLIEHLEEDMNKKKKKRKKKSKMIEDKVEEYVCSLCSVICVSPAVFDSHLNGRKHAAKIKKHTEALLEDKQIQEEIIQDNGHLTDMIEELQFQPREAPENIDCLEKQNKELRERCATTESVEELCQTFEEVEENENISLPNAECIITELNLELSGPKEAREWFHAIIKKLELSQDANLTRELESVPNHNLEVNSGDPESSSAEAPEHPEEYMDKKNKDTVAKYEAEREPYVCSICSVICDCPIVFESHLMGRRHAAGVQKHAEVLFDDKKIIEESLQEKDHPRDTLEELRYQPKETQEIIKEVSQITKEPVENESEQLLNLEFAEPREAREPLERLEISLEDTSNQKSCEGEAENTSEHAEEDVGEKRNNNGAAASQIRVCEWCNVMCSSQVVFDSHLTGKKHAATVKKHAAVVKKQDGTKVIYVRKNGP